MFAFDDYWKRSLDDLRFDPAVRDHPHGMATMAFLPRPLHVLAGPVNLFATTGFLPPEFRTMLGYRLYLWDLRLRARRGRRII
jgi:uncharacterized protein (DUF2236 family)